MSVDDIKYLSSYKESDFSTGRNITFLEMVSSYDPKEIARIKSKNRDLAIDAIVDDKVEEYENRAESLHKWPDVNSIENTYPTYITPVFRKIKIVPKKFISYSDCYNEIIDHIESSTQISNQPDLTYVNDSNYSDSENLNMFSRRLITRIVASGSAIAVESRIGHATCVLVGLDILYYIQDKYFDIDSSKPQNSIIGSLNGVPVIVSNRISRDKVVVFRSEKNIDSGGLIFIEDKKRGEYYFTQTDNTFDKRFKYFRVN